MAKILGKEFFFGAVDIIFLVERARCFLLLFFFYSS